MLWKSVFNADDENPCLRPFKPFDGPPSEGLTLFIRGLAKTAYPPEEPIYP